MKMYQITHKKIGAFIAETTLLISAFLLPSVALADAPEVTTTGAGINSLTSVTLTGFIDTQFLRTTYWFELGKEQGSFPIIYPTHTKTDPGKVSEYLTKVTPNHTYYYRLVARNEDGRTYGDVQSFTTGNDGSINTSNNQSSNTITTTYGGTTVINSGSSVYRGPSMVTSFATNVTGSSFTMNGFIDPNGGTGVYRWFEWGDTSDLGNTSNYTAISSVPTNFSFTLSGLQQNRTYYFRAMGRNQYGISAGNIYTVKTTSGGTIATTGVSPVLASQPGIALTTTSIQANGLVIPGSAPLTRAYFQWGTTQNLGNITVMQSVHPNQSTKISQTISGLSPGTTYFYRVVAQDNANQTYVGGITQVNTLAKAATVAGAKDTSSPTKPPSATTASRGGWFSGWFSGSNDSSETKNVASKNNTTSGAAGVVYTKTTSGILGWFFAIVFFITSVILAIILRSKNKKEVSEDIGFPEFPQEFQPQNIK